jgi:hypothetical protein
MSFFWFWVVLTGFFICGTFVLHKKMMVREMRDEIQRSRERTVAMLDRLIEDADS